MRSSTAAGISQRRESVASPPSGPIGKQGYGGQGAAMNGRSPLHFVFIVPEAISPWRRIGLLPTKIAIDTHLGIINE
jgi:hypothetical protein